MHKTTIFLLISLGSVFVLGCSGLKPPSDMNKYIKSSSNEVLKKRAMSLDPKLTKAADKDFQKAVEACDDNEQEMCDHYSTLALIKLETVLDKVAIEDAKKLLVDRTAEIEKAKAALETQNIRKDAYAERIDGAKKIQALEAKLKTESNKAEQERMKHKIEMEKRAAELKARATDLEAVQSKFSQQKGKLDVLSERTKLVEDAAIIVGNDSVKQTPSGIVVTMSGLFKRKKTEMEIYGRSTCEQIAKIILKYPRYPILIEGHTDSRGSDSANIAKSQARAQSIMNQFIESKVPIGRMTAAGRGEGLPVSDNKTKDGKYLNNRIEVKFIYPTQDQPNKS